MALRVDSPSLAAAFTVTSVSPFPPFTGKTVSQFSDDSNVQSALDVTVNVPVDSCAPNVNEEAVDIAFFTKLWVNATVFTALPPDTMLMAAVRSSIPELVWTVTLTMVDSFLIPPDGRNDTQSASLFTAQSASAVTVNSRVADSGPDDRISGQPKPLHSRMTAKAHHCRHHHMRQA